jgi:hypothetical protein
VAYPVRAYACPCGWHGLLASLEGLARRRRQLRLVLALLAFGLGVGFVAWKYRADIVWSPQRAAPGDGVEEAGGP